MKYFRCLTPSTNSSCLIGTNLTKHERAANYLLSLDGLNRGVGVHWTDRFLDRHPEYFKRKQKPLAVERKNAHNHFESFRKLDEWFGLASEDMWKMDDCLWQGTTGYHKQDACDD